VGAGYFCRCSGQVTDEVVMEYIENQGRVRDMEFGLEGDPG
jgi:REP element-mobilizing transposase RayT